MSPTPAARRLLVLIADGHVGHDERLVLHSDGLVIPAGPVPVTLNFSPQELIGTATLQREGDRVYADVTSSHTLSGLTPCVGGRLLRWALREDGLRDALEYELAEVSFCRVNVDDRIPAAP